MKILVTGNRGYIGRVLCTRLAEAFGDDLDLVGLDSGFYDPFAMRQESAREIVQQVHADIRDVDGDFLVDYDAVVHLAALSNDPLGEFDQRLTFEINRDAAIKLAVSAKRAGVRKFVYFSTQSIYGQSPDDFEVPEDFAKKPMTAYAKSKYEAETEILKLNDDNFQILALRPSTVFGPSPSFRSDIVFNNFCSSAFVEKEIVVFTDGSPIRPAVSVDLVAQTVVSALSNHQFRGWGLAVNLGVGDCNFTVKQLAQIVADVFDVKIKFGQTLPDERSYRIGFSRFKTLFPDLWRDTIDMHESAMQNKNFFIDVGYQQSNFRTEQTQRLKALKNLIDSKKLTTEFRWDR